MPDEDTDDADEEVSNEDDECYRHDGDMKNNNERGKEEDCKDDGEDEDDERFYEEMLELIRKDFKREVLILSKLNHTNIVKVYFLTHFAIIFLRNVNFNL